MRKFNHTIILVACLLATASCEKLVVVDKPIDSITTTEVFNTDEQARAAMAGVYSKMINGEMGNGTALGEFSSGLVTVLGGFSSDELTMYSTTVNLENARFISNKVLRENSLTPVLWSSAYTTIYDANAVIEGIAASTSSRLNANTRKTLTGEAKFIRAFSYFYLLNFFGDVPLVLTVDFNKTRNAARAPKAEVYKQIIKDLIDAQADLPPVNANAAGEKIFPNKWAATALLARAYLFTGDHENAFKQSSAAIANNGSLILEEDLQKTFLKDSREAIWQLKQTENPFGINANGTPEGIGFIPGNSPGDPLFHDIYYCLTDYLVNTFEDDDQRFTNWVGVSPVNITGSTKYFPYKYKTGPHNKVSGAAPTEYYMPLRLAEQYLIRAEAAANGAAALTDAIDDLNAIRHRAGLNNLPYSLTQPQVLEAVEKERRTELFIEWGHRWLDLKRTGKASLLLPQLPVKQPWAGDYQLLYPIPPGEITTNRNLTPNPGYF